MKFMPLTNWLFLLNSFEIQYNKPVNVRNNVTFKRKFSRQDLYYSIVNQILTD